MKTELEIRNRLDELIAKERAMDTATFVRHGELLLVQEDELAWILDMPYEELQRMRGYPEKFIQQMQRSE
jgi:hypothetical protein